MLSNGQVRIPEKKSKNSFSGIRYSNPRGVGMHNDYLQSLCSLEQKELPYFWSKRNHTGRAD